MMLLGAYFEVAKCTVRAPKKPPPGSSDTSGRQGDTARRAAKKVCDLGWTDRAYLFAVPRVNDGTRDSKNIRKLLYINELQTSAQTPPDPSYFACLSSLLWMSLSR